MSNSRFINRWLCALNRHDWLTEVLGYTYHGNVYPLQRRTCRRCGRVEQQVFNESDQAVRWQQQSR